MNIKCLMDLAGYRGPRRRKGLPVRGQRTHADARTGGSQRIAELSCRPWGAVLDIAADSRRLGDGLEDETRAITC